MRLITELHQDLNYLSEGKEGEKKTLFIEGIFAQSECKNRNGRVYPKAVLESAIDRYINDKVKIKTAYGELGHPSGPKINEDRISHLVESLKWNGNDVVGRAKILDTPMGKITKAIIEGGGQIAVSTRGMGSVKQAKDGIVEVQSDFRLATAADIVTDPSCEKAFVTSIAENIEWIYDEFKDEWIVQEMIEKTNKKVKSLSSSQLEEQKFYLLRNFLQELSRK